MNYCHLTYIISIDFNYSVHLIAVIHLLSSWSINLLTTSSTIAVEIPVHRGLFQIQDIYICVMPILALSSHHQWVLQQAGRQADEIQVDLNFLNSLQGNYLDFKLLNISTMLLQCYQCISVGYSQVKLILKGGRHGKIYSEFICVNIQLGGTKAHDTIFKILEFVKVVK